MSYGYVHQQKRPKGLKWFTSKGIGCCGVLNSLCSAERNQAEENATLIKIKVRCTLCQWIHIVTNNGARRNLLFCHYYPDSPYLSSYSVPGTSWVSWRGSLLFIPHLWTKKKEDVLYYLAQGRTFPLHQVTSDLCVRALYFIPVFTPCTHQRIFYLTPSSLPQNKILT